MSSTARSRRRARRFGCTTSAACVVGAARFYNRARLNSSLLIAEEVAVANMLAENRAESVLGPVGPHIGPEPVMLSLWS